MKMVKRPHVTNFSEVYGGAQAFVERLGEGNCRLLQENLQYIESHSDGMKALKLALSRRPDEVPEV